MAVTTKSTASVPKLDGVLVTNEAARIAAADDFGHIVHRLPAAVLKPGSVEDIARMIRFARENDLKIAARGQGHSTIGQPQVEAGIVVDMRTLATVHSVGTGYADVDAGVVWSTLLDATLPFRQTPPVLTDYLEVTVGGTLAVGGIGGMSSRYGAQIDQVLALTVVTGEGDIVECSMTQNRHLFEATLGGLGQCGIIVRARVHLVPAPTQVTVYILSYTDLATFTDDQVRLMQEKRFDYVEGQVVPNPAGGWMYLLEAAFYYSPPTQPDDTTLLAGLRNNPGSVIREDKPYRDFVHRLDPLVTLLKTAGAWDVPHPWFDVFVPGSQVIGYVGDVLANLTPADTGNGLVLLYPIPTALFERPRLQLPSEPVAFLFDILRFAIPGLSVGVDAMLAANRTLYDQVVALGGTRYPIGAIPNYTLQDWKRHYDSEWGKVETVKHQYDPYNVLTPGQGIFSQPHK